MQFGYYTHDNQQSLKFILFPITFSTKIYNIHRTNLEDTGSTTETPTSYCYEGINEASNGLLNGVYFYGTAMKRLAGWYWFAIGI